jgi:hypothetical protein
MKKLSVKLMILAALVMGSCTKGDPGPQGPKGNANVVTLNQVTLQNYSYNSSNRTWSTSISSASITQDIIDNGVVMVYEKFGSGWCAWNYTIAPTAYTCAFSPGKVELVIQNTDFSVPDNPNGMVVKVVIIPASEVSQKVNYNDFQTVKKQYQLSE